LVVVGNGMVGHRLLKCLVDNGAIRRFSVTVFGEETRACYDRVALSSLFDGMSPEDLSLVDPGFFDSAHVQTHFGDRVVSIDRSAKRVVSQSGVEVPYDKLVLATGAAPFVPPIDGRDLAGCFVYRTVDDVDAIRAWAKTAKSGAVIGGGLLGLEAAHALE